MSPLKFHPFTFRRPSIAISATPRAEREGAAQLDPPRYLTAEISRCRDTDLRAVIHYFHTSFPSYRKGGKLYYRLRPDSRCENGFTGE